MKPHLVIFSAFLSPLRSGAEACAEEIALRLTDGYEVTIITAKLRSDLPRHSILHSISVIRVGLGHPIDKWLYPFLAPLAARKLKPDLVHGILETFAGAAVLMYRYIGTRAPRFLTLQTTNRSFLKAPIIRAADRVTAISSVLVRKARDAGVDAELIPNGIDLSAITKARQQFSKVPGRILFVGRLENVKGVDTLLVAFSRMPSTPVHQSPIANLHIVGDGSEKESLQELARELDIADRVRFLGRLTGDALYREYAEAEIFCGLSRSEALGNVFLEAQAAGCAVIATNVGGIPDIVKDGVTGLLVPPDDVRAAADTLQKLLTDPILRSKIADGGKAHAKAYDWDDIVNRYASAYDSLLSRTN